MHGPSSRSPQFAKFEPTGFTAPAAARVEHRTRGVRNQEELRLPAWVTPVVVGGAFLLITWLESRRPLRERKESRERRLGRNLSTAGITAAITSAVQAQLLEPLVRRAERENLGLLNRLALPRWIHTTLGILLLDYTLWWWHFLNHRVPLLWRFHLVHHVDLDLDASTALRFHFGEMSLSVFFRMA